MSGMPRITWVRCSLVVLWLLHSWAEGIARVPQMRRRNKLRRNTSGDKKKMGCGEQAAYLSDVLEKTKTEDNWTINAVYAYLFFLPSPHQFLILKSDNEKDPLLYLDPWSGTCSKKPPSNLSKIESIDKMGTTDCPKNAKDKKKTQ